MPPLLTDSPSPATTGLPDASEFSGRGIGAPGERVFWADAIRAYAIAAVVIIHCCVPYVFNFRALSPFDWWVCNFLDSFSRAGVGLFVMLSGMFLLEKNETIPSFFRKRFAKVVLPFFFWQAFYAVWLALKSSHGIDLATFWPTILVKPTSFHLWYPFMLIGLYLATPILRVYVQNASRANLLYFLFSWLSIVSLAPVLERVLHWNASMQPVIAIGYSGYFVLGYYLQRYVDGVVPRIFMIAPIALATLTAVVTNFLCQHKGGLDETAYDYLSPNVVLLCICVFFSLKKLASQSDLLKHSLITSLISSTSRASYGVYLIHIVVLVYLSEALHLSWQGHAALSVLILAVGTLGVSVAIVRLLQAIPVLRALVP